MLHFDKPSRITDNWGPFGFLLSIAILLVAIGFLKSPAPLIFADTDEAMRLVQLRDFIAGQAWRDLVPHRLDPSSDVPMHWSRLVDLSMALIYWPLAHFLTAAAAERAMALIWPPLMLAICAIPLFAITRRLGGVRAAKPAMILILAAGTLVQFLPGRIDHHSAQMAAALFAILATMGRSRASLAAMAGFTTALALALGIETIPYLLILGCFFAVDAIRNVRLASVRAYAASLGVAAFLLFIVSTAPHHYGFTACDVLTLNVLAGVLAGALGLYGACRVIGQRATSFQLRTALIVAVAIGAVATSLALEPRCARGVIGTFDPQIRPLWFDHIEEVSSVFKTMRTRPSLVLQWYFIPVLGSVALLIGWRSFLRRDDARVMVGCFLAALIVACVQVRGAFYAGMFAIPFLAIATVRGIEKFRQLARWHTAPQLVALVLVAISFGISQTVGRSADADNRDDRNVVECNRDAIFKELATLPAGLVLAPVDLGPYILLYTEHSVISAPYHRFDRGIVLGQSILYTMDIPQAQRAIMQRGIDYLVFCRDNKKTNLAELIDAHQPGWLREASAPGAAARIFKIERLDPPRS